MPVDAVVGLPAHGAHGSARVAADLGWEVFAILVVLLLVAAALAQVAALRAAAPRGRWPWWRTLAWHAGLLCAGVALVGPLAMAARSSFTAHMAGHLLLGMVAPLLLVLAAPVTLALRALPAPSARRLVRLLRTRFVRVVAHPLVAAVLNAGGLWLLYTTDLYRLMHGSVLVHALVHAHVLLAGWVFTASVVGVDPDPHRSPMTVRATVLVLFVAAHSLLGKWLYVHPPAGVEQADARAGAQLMYYGGDVVDVTLMVLLLLVWYRATRPRTGVRTASAAPSATRGAASPLPRPSAPARRRTPTTR